MNDAITTNQAAVSRDVRRAELAELAFQPNGQMFQPRDGRELMDMANLMSTSGFMVKDIYRNNPGACMGLIAVCAPYGMNPLQVSWKTYQASKTADAPIAYEAQVIVAMINASGAVRGSLRYKYDGEGQARRCCAYATLKGDTEAVEVWSPMISQITVKNSPLWKNDPDQQLAYYTGRSWVRRYKPEMLLGIYDVDELDGVRIGPEAAKDITPKENGFADIAKRARQPEPVSAMENSPQDGEVTQGGIIDAKVEDASPTDARTPFYQMATSGAPGGASWDRGVTAFEDGKPITDCPYDTPEARQEAEDWCGGWVNAERAKA